MKIEIKALEKKYDNGFKALKGIDLEITEGMFGLLGPNGAGKSTLMKILVTMQDYTTGSILIDGKDIRNRITSYNVCYTKLLRCNPTWSQGFS